MTHLADPTPCSFLATAVTPPALNAGWLGPARAFGAGVAEPEFHRRLFARCSQPVHRMRGIHQCGFCEMHETSVVRHHYRPPDEIIRAALR